jgi:hypothetical protein
MDDRLAVVAPAGFSKLQAREPSSKPFQLERQLSTTRNNGAQTSPSMSPTLPMPLEAGGKGTGAGDSLAGTGICGGAIPGRRHKITIIMQDPQAEIKIFLHVLSLTHLVASKFAREYSRYAYHALCTRPPLFQECRCALAIHPQQCSWRSAFRESAPQLGSSWSVRRGWNLLFLEYA